MAFPTALNDQTTDSVTQSNVNVVASSPALAMGSLYQSYSSTRSLALQNAVTKQQEKNTLSNAIVSNCVNSLTKI